MMREERARVAADPWSLSEAVTGAGDDLQCSGKMNSGQLMVVLVTEWKFDSSRLGILCSFFTAAQVLSFIVDAFRDWMLRFCL
ncbi:hypothetical protein Droror1_Dr00017688 [Drosera rotundifolia]